MKKEKNRKLKGSVLLTVVFVMSILILFLFGTMTLAMAANNRAHVNYSSAQTGITARAVAESAIIAIENSSESGKNYAKAVGGLTNGSMNVPVQLVGEGVNTLGDVSDVTISHAGSIQYFDPITKKWETRDLLKFTSIVEMSGVRSSASVYVVKYLKTDKVAESGGGAGFVSTADAVFKTQQSLFGGAYVNLPTHEQADAYEDNYISDSYEARVNSRTFRGVNDKVEPIELYNSSAYIEAEVFVNNDVNIENWSGFIFPGAGKGITILGDLHFNNVNATDHLNYVLSSDLPSDLPFNQIPFIYVDGNITGGDGAVKLGNAKQTFPMNTFCGSIKAGGNPNGAAKSVISTNLYCMDSDGKNQILGVKQPLLVTWVTTLTNGSTAGTRSTEVKGEICSKGDLELDNVTIYGDVRVEGKLKIGHNVIVNGNVVCNNIENVKGLTCYKNIYNDNLATGASGEEYTFNNKVGFYYEYTPVMNQEGKYIGINGDKLNDSVFDDGVPNSKYEDNIPKMYYKLKNDLDFEHREIKDNVTGNGEFKDYYYEGTSALEEAFAEQSDVEDALSELDLPSDIIKYGYYKKTDITDFKEAEMLPEESEDSETGVVVKEGCDYIEIDGTTYEFKYTTSEAKANGKTFTKYINTSDSKVFNTNYKKVEEYFDLTREKIKSIYPVYAERSTLYGKNSFVDDVESTKIVKTVNEVFEIADPYELTKLPNELSDIYEGLGDDDKIGSKNAAISKFGDGKVYETTNSDNPNYTIVVGKEKQLRKYSQAEAKSDNPNAAYYISGSCILTAQTISNDVIINPGNSNILVVISGEVSIESGKHILIDDSNGGTVYFYIDNDSKLWFKGNTMCTKTYFDAFATKSKFSFGSGNLGDDYQQIEKLAKPFPNVYVYGGTASSLIIENMDIMTMNVISPHITSNISGGTGTMIDSLIYNGYETRNLSSNYIIGCYNINNVESKNQMNVVYVPKDKNSGPTAVSEDDRFWYRTLYYNEF
ncbi:MAG: polymer-forming cytoskeletal protein [Ruminococcus sp.]|nr:polymer-forming cytoskeletal protein [Ruminococcus sp.]